MVVPSLDFTRRTAPAAPAAGAWEVVCAMSTTSEGNFLLAEPLQVVEALAPADRRAVRRGSLRDPFLKDVDLGAALDLFERDRDRHHALHRRVVGLERVRV